jgi:competence protein ComEA
LVRFETTDAGIANRIGEFSWDDEHLWIWDAASIRILPCEAREQLLKFTGKIPDIFSVSSATVRTPNLNNPLGGVMPNFASLFLTLVLFVFAPGLRAEPIDINSATVEQIDEALVGVGKVKAQAIVQDREKNGKFKSVDDLVRVKGIGPATVAKNRSKITVGAEAPAEQPAASAPPAVPPVSALPGGTPAKPK